MEGENWKEGVETTMTISLTSLLSMCLKFRAIERSKTWNGSHESPRSVDDELDLSDFDQNKLVLSIEH